MNVFHGLDEVRLAEDDVNFCRFFNLHREQFHQDTSCTWQPKSLVKARLAQ
jgi:hypothetical protein